MTEDSDSSEQIEDLLERCFRRPEADWAGSLRSVCTLYPELSADLQQRYEELYRERSTTGGDAGVSGSYFMDGLTFSDGDAILPLPAATEEFKFVGELGRGGMGVVYEAEDLASGRHVAVKVVTPRLASSPRSLERFDREARAAASISHPNCVFVYGTHRVAGAPAISMELVSGNTLDTHVRTDEPVPVAQAVSWILQALDGLESAHARGILHRDVKPSNLFMTDGDQVKIGDFGLSRGDEVEMTLTQSGAFLGSPLYASPEQTRGRGVDARSDIYSMGATLFALLTGRPPFEGSSIGDIFTRISTDSPPDPDTLRPGMPEGLGKVVLHALAKKPEDRFADCASMKHALKPYAAAKFTPGGFVLRAAAWFVDFLVVSALAVGVQLGMQELGAPIGARTPLGVAVDVGSFFLYLALLEGLTGTTLGKWVCGLRVVRSDGQKVGLGRASLRTATWVMAQGVEAATGGTVPRVLVRLSFFLTARRRNGYRGVHELVSGTRVVQTRAPFVRSARDSVLRPNRGNAAGALAAHEVIGLIGPTDRGRLLVARDPSLDRRVWLHRLDVPEGGTTRAARHDTAGTRLHWLSELTDQGATIDVFEDPGGASLHEYREYGAVLDWDTTRSCLIDLLDDVEREPRPLALGHLWLDDSGHIRIFDFRLGGEIGAPTNDAVKIVGRTARTLLGVDRSPDGWRLKIATGDRFTAERVLGFATPFEDARALRAAIESIEAHDPRVPRRRRIAQLIGSGIFLVIPLGGAATVLSGFGDGLVRVNGEPTDFAELLSVAIRLSVALVMTGGAWFISCMMAFLLRGGASLRLFGLEVALRDGRAAGRWRCVWRQSVAWLPTLIGLGALSMWSAGADDIRLISGRVALGLLAIWPLTALFDADRAWHDRLAGTRVVKS